MNTNKTILILVSLIGLILIGRTALSKHGMGTVYVKAVEVNKVDPNPDNRWIIYQNASLNDYINADEDNPKQNQYYFSLSRSIGVWVAAFFTLFIFSFLYKDNLFYKIAESVVIGVSAAYWMVVGFWTVIIPNLIGKIWPALIHSWAMPGIAPDREPYWYLYLIPLLLGVLLLMRLSPTGSWLSRWPLAFIIGTTAGMRLVGFLHADFLSQISNTIIPIWVTDSAGAFDFWASLRSLIIVIGVLCAIVYFFFSIEHKGWVGKTAKVGIWCLMITFGAAFGYTVMGRIALLAIRLEFLMDDWLWIIDPGKLRDLATIAHLGM